MRNTMTVNGCTIRLEKADLTACDVEAIVFYAEPTLRLGSGFGNAIAMRGGPAVQKELNTMQPVTPCGAVVSGAGNLSAQYIVHAVGPRFQEQDTEEKLHRTMLNSLGAAEARGIRRIAFPPMGTGFYGIPLKTCARVMLSTIQEYLRDGSNLEEIAIIVMNRREFEPFQELMG